MTQRETIAAIATAAGAAGVGIVRLSGAGCRAIAATFLGRPPIPRQAHYLRFRDADGAVIDDGLLIFFPGPQSYTGEDVLELQGHGSPVLLGQLLRRCLALGARAARPGEFTERAFLEGRLDLAQAEAVADLVAAGSEAAARAARRSLEGEFSRRVDQVVEGLTGLRVWIEAALDFPDEEIDFLAAPELQEKLQRVAAQLDALRTAAERGRRLVDGLHVVIAGAPNAGKSSLLNALAGEDRAIVTAIAGTTRDLLRERIRIDGIELTLVDTAGLRDAPDLVEREGIRRAREELDKADLVLAVVDATGSAPALALPAGVPVLWLHSKADLLASVPAPQSRADGRHLWLSVRDGQGLDALRAALREAAGLGEGADGSFSARARHVDALARGADALARAAAQLHHGAGELAAEELRQAQDALGEITGRVDADALLGRIFGDFCIGK
ncbi:MAG TPA: tRNA uridine-5-carboxymethylaminomethyl(34) synthesis GTPase MnmE [Arenimonas sp.]|uniref:tRNA uridine-5-carboxymethylaminomethyl(34) synthesis GTPase MnmE n=1 Tax=Arenimonas sp. TaxID=1872635 RepID=UPI002D7FAC5E|nr:tRNA uridine-5-carboxymethylaminomethyl(34) synthesis GTPase MnmE [Arenimonas sp.]HEU0152194.1 tRNA uridine-5-carboxymethylaminomethyl(34) synthesis GTPase MnmE [Arenimonas sp.]